MTSSQTPLKTIVVLGGYGNFGKRIVQGLAAEQDLRLLIAGRSIDKASLLVDQLQNTSAATLIPLAIDINSADFGTTLNELSPDIVIHTSGPFQGQDYRVPLACIDAGVHYIDLADDRTFVCDIDKLAVNARKNKVLVVSGASSVPGLSSTVIDHYRSDFSTINAIDIAIAPGNKAERGMATVRAILSYTGKPFSVFSHGQWVDAFGWMTPRQKDFGQPVGKRWLANVDVPDLALFPRRYRVKNTVKFQAGLELPWLHLTLVAMAKLAKVGLINNWSPLTPPIVKVSDWFIGFGTDKGAMQIEINGLNQQGKAKTVVWSLCAVDGVGPYIPTLSAIIIAKKLLSGELTDIGATPCLGLYSLAEFLPYAEQHGITFKVQVNG